MGPKNFDPEIMGLFGDLWDACKACENADEAQWRRAKDSLSVMQQVQSWCSEDQIEKAHARGRELVAAMWNAFDALKAGYVEHLQPHANVAVDLHNVALQTWDPVIAALDPIIADVEARMKQTHWSGAAADRYMKQLPVQLAALQEFKQYAAVGRAGVDTPALLQQKANQGMRILIGVTQYQVHVSSKDRDSEDQYFSRCQRAGDFIASQFAAFKERIVAGKDLWAEPLAEHVSRMTSDVVRNPLVLTGDTWPKAVKPVATPSASKYTPPSGVEE